MNKKSYVKQLNRSLYLLSRKERKAICEEIQSLIENEGIDDKQLIERLGSPQQLAQNYIDESHQGEQPWWRHLMARILQFIGIIFIILLVLVCTLIIYFIYYIDTDSFDYAKYNAHNLPIDQEGYHPFVTWQPLTDQPLTKVRQIEVKQAKVIVYWYDTQTISWACKHRSDSHQSEQTLSIHKNNCLLRLPKSQFFEINTWQSNMVLIKPYSSQIQLNQSELSLDLSDDTSMHLNSHQSDISHSPKIRQAIKSERLSKHITIDSEQSQIESYIHHE